MLTYTDSDISVNAPVDNSNALWLIIMQFS
jgi:hypothetical protein